MTDQESRLAALGEELRPALERHAARRRRRRLGAVVLPVALALVFSTAALASDSVGLHTFGLDPAQFELLGGERIEPDAEYIYARNKSTGSTDAFVHTKDDGMDRYAAFQLHQRAARAAAAASGVPAVEEGADCSADELTRAQVVALQRLSASYEPGSVAPTPTNPSAHHGAEAAVDEAVKGAFAGAECSGLGYAGEIALLVFARLEPVENLMPGARETARQALCD